MYCTTCGAQIKQGARFCTSCGARVEGMPADGTAPAGPGSAPNQAESDHAVERADGSSVSSSQPQKDDAGVPADGDRPAGLGARVLQFRRTALAAVPAWALVVLALLLAAGTAYAVYKAVTVWALPALEQAQSEEEEAAEEVEETPASDEQEEEAEEEAALTDEQVMYRLYYEKCQEYIELYGEPGVVEDEDYGYISAYGLAVAELMDFDGDGVDELLLAWCTESETVASDGISAGILAASSYVELYRIEVWSYSDGALACSYSDVMPTAAEGMGGDYILIYQYEGRLCVYTARTWYEDGDDDYYHSELWLAMGDDGTFETVLSSSGQIGSLSYTVDGAEATAEEWSTAFASLESVQSCYLSTWPDGDVPSSDTVLTPEDLVALTNETLAQLEAGM